MMHRFTLVCCFAIVLPLLAGAQGGSWVWVSGPNSANGLAVFGTQGVAAPGNTPAGVYEAAAWVDKQGKYWIYGGVSESKDEPGDLWKYDPVTLMWTWVKGSGVPDGIGTFGTQGVPSPANNPPGLGWGATTWTDEAGNLWLYGGYGSGGSYGDLWRYNIAGNEWTWINGTGQPFTNASYGTKGVASPSNTPGQKQECTSSWVDAAGNLWLFGGQDDAGTYNDLWMYNIQSGMWTWENGSGQIGSVGNYGTMGVASAGNLPPGRGSYTNWKDQAGNFYIFGGTSDFTSAFSDVWKYDPVTNLWTWVAGENTPDFLGTGSNYCVNIGASGPSARFENRTPQISACQGSTFYSFGGYSNSTTIATNDLWVFNATSNAWTWIDGIYASESAGNYGAQGVASLTNQPPGRCGQSMWVDNAGNLWMFGGSNFTNYFSDVWKFVPNPVCLNPANVGGGGLFVLPGQNPICIGDSTTITVTGGDSLQIWPTATSYFTDTSHAILKPDTTTTYMVTGHSHCRYNDTTLVTINVIKPGQLVYQLSDTNVCGTSPVTLNLTGQANNQISPLTGVTEVDSIAYLLAPPATTTYRLTGTSALCGVPDTGAFTIHVTQPNPVSVTGPTTICLADSFVIYTTGLSNVQVVGTGFDFSDIIYPDSIVFYPFTTGTFPAYISGTNSCGGTYTDTLQFTWLDGGGLTDYLSTNAICPGGSAYLEIFGATAAYFQPSASVTYIDSTYVILSPAVTTTYIISASSACNTDSLHITITVLAPGQISYQLSDTSICSGSYVFLTLNQQDTSSITPSTGVINEGNQTYYVDPAVTTTYTVTGTSLCGGADSGTFTIYVIQPNPLADSVPPPTCNSANITVNTTGLIDVNVVSGNDYTSVVYPDSIVFSLISSAGTYPAVITGLNSCGAFVEDTVELTWVGAGALSFSASSALICPGDSTLLTVNSPPAISVTPSASVTWVNSTQAWLKPDSTTNYHIYSTATCLTVDSGVELVTVSPQAHAVFTLASQTGGTQTVITLNSQSTGYTALSWYHDSSLLQLINNTVSTADTGNYCVTLVAVNTAGCDDTATHCIEINGQSYLQVPGAFSPNGDGVNDYFTIYAKNLSSYQIRIYNRWGEEVYSSSDLTELNNLSRGWDGTYKGKLQDPASFTWAIKAVDDGGNIIEKKGYVILIR